jgi:hypothetical protein
MDNDRDLCIVADAAREDVSGAFLPFEGDRMLSLILAKAVMLAADDKIANPGIRAQIGL